MSRGGRRPADETRVMRLGDQAEAAATVHSRGPYPRPENPRYGQLDRWDFDRGSAPRPIRDPIGTARWVRAGLLVTVVLIVLAICWACGVPRT